MKKSRSLFFLIFAFVVSQFAWMGLLGLWIYWYVSNYLIFKQVGNQLSPQIAINSPNVFVFVGGIILIVAIAVAIVLFFRDLTVQIKLTGLYDNFIANVTHELKSPLSSIQLYLETLQVKNVPERTQKEFFGLMMKDATRLNKLINTILEISRIEQKKISHDYNIYDADEVIRELLNKSTEHFRLSPKSVLFEGNLNCKCVVDKNAMQIVFDNLTDNAIKYSVGHAEITIKLSNTGKRIMIEFLDKGIGILPKDQKKIFHKFQRIQNNTITNVKGTGLGLYWIKEIIKQHGGKVGVFSEGALKGSNFIIELPIYKTSKKRYINSLLKRTLKKQKSWEIDNGE